MQRLLITSIILVLNFYSSFADPRCVIVNIKKNGSMIVAGREISKDTFREISQRAMNEYGNDIPFAFKVDKRCKYSDLSSVINVMKELHAYKALFFSKSGGPSCRKRMGNCLSFYFVYAHNLDKQKHIIKIEIDKGSYKVNGKALKLKQIEKIVADKSKKGKTYLCNLQDFLFTIPIKETPIPKKEPEPERIRIQEDVEPIEIEVEIKDIKIEELERPPEPPKKTEDSEDEELEISIEKDQDVLIQCAEETPFSTLVPLVYIVKQHGLTPVLILFNHKKNALITKGVFIVRKTEKEIHYRNKCEKCDYVEKETLNSSFPKDSSTINLTFECRNCGCKNKGQIKRNIKQTQGEK